MASTPATISACTAAIQPCHRSFELAGSMSGNAVNYGIKKALWKRLAHVVSRIGVIEVVSVWFVHIDSE